MSITLHTDLKNDLSAMQSFFALAEEIFDLSFQKWYEQGYWGKQYIPYTLFDNSKAIANVSANIIETQVNNQPKLYIQIGTVMTAPAYRNKGYARRLIHLLLQQWEHKCNGIYLYANDTVLDFYPKFGFEPAKEYLFKKEIIPNSLPLIPLNMDDQQSVSMLKNYYQRGNPFCARPLLNNFGLLMFYCGGPMKDCVYYIPQLDCIAIVSFDGPTMTCYELLCSHTLSMNEALSAAARPNTETVSFGFMPKDTNGCVLTESNAEEQLFVYSKKENMFKEAPMMLPLLSHA